MKVLLRIPKAVEQELRRMVDECLADTQADREDRALLELLFSHVNGYSVARDIPEITVRVACRVLGLDRKPEPETLQHWERYRGMEGIEDAFGLPPGLDHRGHPSAYHGPYPWRVGFNILVAVIALHPDGTFVQDKKIQEKHCGNGDDVSHPNVRTF